MVRLGQPVRVVSEPGLNVKAPFIDSVVYFAKSILDLEAPSQLPPAVLGRPDEVSE